MSLSSAVLFSSRCRYTREHWINDTYNKSDGFYKTCFSDDYPMHVYNGIEVIIGSEIVECYLDT